ncbi:hypothetical protein M902_0465 [Bacteriovorax sp. BAL6_X]|uniref:hypothetical protein n=1 Tax=Bacteriovorax sp. BAL6_X TaxID=1201290 RepID=UPI000385E15C|nr:hypothetical protein [Bacteriovorax sp. BAL6_X]EPZ50161.1 hypothetical protein M902_0465 [Bacteriovorax sp. BAL6_X]
MTNSITRLSREMMYVSDNVFYILFSILILLICVIVVYWFYTRKRMQELQHQIPANVLKSYLDSVIQNSNALKSSLFRGGGLEAGEGIPSVVPGGSLPTGNVDGAQLASKNAEIAALNGQIANKDSLIRDLEAQLGAVEQSGDNSDSAQIITNLNSEIAELKSQVEVLKSSSASVGDNSAELSALSSERDELQARLKEYEMIEGDLADLRKFKQENEQLKAQLAEGGGTPSTPAPEVDLTPDPEPEVDLSPEPEEVIAPDEEPVEAPEPVEVPEPESLSDNTTEFFEEPIEEATTQAAPEPIEEAEAPAPTAAAAEVTGEKAPENEATEQKSAEELLSEFEKMLG